MKKSLRAWADSVTPTLPYRGEERGDACMPPKMYIEDDAMRRVVIAICEAIGFGRVMQIAADEWHRRDPVGALTVGPPESVAQRQIPQA